MEGGTREQGEPASAAHRGNGDGASGSSLTEGMRPRELWSRVAQASGAVRDSMMAHAGVPPYVSAAADAASAAAVGTSPGAWGFAGAPPLSDFAPHEPAAGLGLISSGLDVCPPDAEPTTSVEYTQLMQGAVVVGRVVQCQARSVVVRVVLQTHVPQSALQLPPRVWFADTPQLLGVLHESDIIEKSQMVPRNVVWGGGNSGSGATPLAELFPLNACVRATVKTVSPGALALSLKPSFIHPSAAAASRGSPPKQPTPHTQLTLGRVTEKEMHALLTAASPPEHALAAPPPRELSYLSTLARTPIFSSPDCTRAMATAYGIRLESTSVSSAWSAMHCGDVEVYAKAVRKELYHKWAQETTRQGVTLAKAGQYNEALKLYRQALEFDSKHRDAYVARGAAYANQGSLTKAVEDFETALSIDPADANAAKYLAATRAKLARTAPAHPSTAPPPESPSDRAGSGASASTGVGRAPPLAAPSAGQAGSGSELERALAEAAARAKQKRKRNKEKKRSKRKGKKDKREKKSRKKRKKRARSSSSGDSRSASSDSDSDSSSQHVNGRAQ